MNLKNDTQIKNEQSKEVLGKQEKVNYTKIFINFIKYYKIKNKLDEKDPPKLNLGINLNTDILPKVRILNWNLDNVSDIEN